MIFTNPIVSSGADPWVTNWKGRYFHCFAANDNEIGITQAAQLPDIGNGNNKVTVWTSPPSTSYSHEIWAPELHYLAGKWYIYFAADNGDNANHRMYVLEGKTQDPQGQYRLKGKISAFPDRWAIDGTVLAQEDGSLYFIWSGWAGFENDQQNLYIARMDNPWTISGERICISAPEYEWERFTKPFPGPYVNEGPTVLKNGPHLFIIYSASGSWTDKYCLGQLTYLGGDILTQKAWLKSATPVFAGTDCVYSPGHPSFVKSPACNEDWIVYHAAKHKGAGWNRNIRAQPFTWHADGTPNFGRPVAEGVPLTFR